MTDKSADVLQLIRDIKWAAEVMERAYAARDIPTGDLYRGIAFDSWLRARTAFIEAVDRLAALVP